MIASLDIPTVQAFLLVAELHSFTRSAEALGETQAAVSMKLQRLEALLGKRLVERSPRAVRLTADGSAFLEPARALIAAHDRAFRASGSPGRNCRSGSATMPPVPNWCRCCSGSTRYRRSLRCR